MGQAAGEYEEELRFVRIPSGTRLSSSTGTPGYDRDLLRHEETGELLGPPESRPANPWEIDESYGALDGNAGQHENGGGLAVLVALGAAGTLAGIAAMSPRVRGWARAGAGIVRRRSAQAQDAVRGKLDRGSDAPASGNELAGPPRAVGPYEPPFEMSREEYEARLRAVKAAEEWAVAQRGVVARAVVVDAPKMGQIDATVTRALEAGAVARDAVTGGRSVAANRILPFNGCQSFLRAPKLRSESSSEAS